MKKNKYLLTCLKCGKVFEYSNTLKKLCSSCVAANDRERKKRDYELTKSCNAKKVTSKLPSSYGKTISEILRDLAEYNRKNNKCLSYGQYVSLLYIQAQQRKKKKA